MTDFAVNTWQDRQVEDNTLFTQFLTYWQNGEYQNALNLLENNAQLSTKTMTANVFNTISAALTYLQDSYFENVDEFLAEELNRFNTELATFVNKHLYSPTQQYYVNNLVLYENLYYMCIQDSLGNLPTNTSYWVLIGLKGEQGNAGTGLTLRYSWSPTITYNQYDVVYMNGVLYVAMQSSLNQNPPSSPIYWQVFMNVPVVYMTISEEMPVDPYEGQIWIRLLMGAYTWQQVNDLNYTFEDVNNLNINWEFVDEGGW